MGESIGDSNAEIVSISQYKFLNTFWSTLCEHSVIFEHILSPQPAMI